MTSSLLLIAFTAITGYIGLRFVRGLFIPRPQLEQLPGPESVSWVTGNIGKLFQCDAWDYVRGLSEAYGPTCLIHSLFGAKGLLTYDPKAMHTIYIKNQDIWSRSDVSIEAGLALFGPGLLSTQGETHRRQRKMLNPVFSAKYMREITPFFYQIVRKLESAMATRVRAGQEELDVAGWMGRAALELVGQGALGHSFDPLVEDSKDEFTENVKSFFPSTADVTYGFALLTLVKDVRGPSWLRRLVVRLWPDPAVQSVRRKVEIIYAFAKRLVAEKKKAIERGDEALLHQIGEGKDVMSVLLRENMAASEDDRLPEEELVAQIATFIVAGVDTTSNALARALDILSVRPEAQERLRREVLEAREHYGQEIPYNELSALPYLDAVCRETMRVHPSVSFSLREAKQDTVLPLSEPVNGIDHIAVPKGMTVLTNIVACNTNKALWGDDAYEWNPDRWLRPLPTAVEEARIPGIYANSFSFGGGGYSCIGFKFSQLEMKVVLSSLIASFRFERGSKGFVWNLASVAYPTASFGDKDPEMFLKVTCINLA
ncbi:cytochrome P450 [Epithele typhae]|uniref:cytochrome P450 n=1 Tax=Epithele typhae TaxID=378194 RepID=UPI0020074214|nr:cytochrome P450 [Epithele typhae]KAH9923737.1 cytochrome P450 [Epithele typhae]